MSIRAKTWRWHIGCSPRRVLGHMLCTSPVLALRSTIKESPRNLKTKVYSYHHYINIINSFWPCQVVSFSLINIYREYSPYEHPHVMSILSRIGQHICQSHRQDTSHILPKRHRKRHDRGRSWCWHWSICCRWKRLWSWYLHLPSLSKNGRKLKFSKSWYSTFLSGEHYAVEYVMCAINSSLESNFVSHWLHLTWSEWFGRHFLSVFFSTLSPLSPPFLSPQLTRRLLLLLSTGAFDQLLWREVKDVTAHRETEGKTFVVGCQCLALLNYPFVHIRFTFSFCFLKLEFHWESEKAHIECPMSVRASFGPHS